MGVAISVNRFEPCGCHILHGKEAIYEQVVVKSVCVIFACVTPFGPPLGEGEGEGSLRGTLGP